MYTLKVFYEFLKRDFYIYIRLIKRYIFNYGLIYPTLWAIAFGYLIPNLIFQANPLENNSLVLIGQTLPIPLILAFNLNLDFLLDLEQNRFIDYQATILRPKFLMLEKILCSTILTSLLTFLFIIAMKIILRNALFTDETSVWALLGIIIIASIYLSAYVMFSFVIIDKTQHLRIWWPLCNAPQMMLGGLWTPWAIMFKASTILGYIALLNPLTYISEGMRGSILGQSNFINLGYCLAFLTILSVILTYASIRLFIKKFDYI